MLYPLPKKAGREGYPLSIRTSLKSGYPNRFDYDLLCKKALLLPAYLKRGYVVPASAKVNIIISFRSTPMIFTVALFVVKNDVRF